MERLSRRPKETAYVLLGAAVLFSLIPLWMLYQYKRSPAEAANTAETEQKPNAAEVKPSAEKELRYVPVMVWGGALALVFLGIGLWRFAREPGGELTDMETTRLMVLTLGGLSGLFTFLLGLALPYFEWWGIFIGGVEAWRKDWWKIALSICALFGGLALMFVSLQLARPEERSSASLRRLLYGYNAALMGLLLTAILLVVNIVFYVPVSIPSSVKFLQPIADFFTKPSDWTASSIYTLSPASKNLLASIDKPVKLYVLLPKGDQLYTEVQNLMNNCQAVNRLVEVEQVSPDSPRARELMKKYEIPELVGLLVVYGSDPREEHEFIGVEDLVSQDQGGAKKYYFKGEDELVKKLTYLSQGKSRALVYFAQGDGELDMNDMSAQAPDRGMGVLKDRLQKANYEVKELRLDDPTLRQIPADADVVVIARPTQPLSQSALGALGAYLNPSGPDSKKGKLIVLLDLVTDREGNMVQTGLEKFLEDYNVKVNNDRILIVPNNVTQYPLQIFAYTNPASRNPLVTAFGDFRWLFTEVRTVDPAFPQNNPKGRYISETLLFAPGRYTLLESGKLRANPVEYVDSLLKDFDRDENRRKELQGLLSPRPLSVAVTVTEPKGPPANDDPHAFMRQQTKQEPRLVVFGDASWASNKEISRGGSGNFELLRSLLSWLRERPDVGKMADPKERNFFTLQASPEAITRMQWLPGILICIGLLGLGGGIWIVRRR
jgi:hypothetical protein